MKWQSFLATLLFLDLSAVQFQPPLSVLVFYSLIADKDINAINEIICSSNESEYEFRVLSSGFASLEKVKSCLRESPVHTVSLTHPDRQSNIVSTDDARIAALYQNAGNLTGIDIIAFHITNADVVLVGNSIYEPPYSFLLHVFAMIPNPPITIVLSSELLTPWNTHHVHSRMSHVIQRVLHGNVVFDGALHITHVHLRTRIQSQRSFKHSPSTCVSSSSRHNITSDEAGREYDGSCLWRRNLPRQDTERSIDGSDMRMLDADNEWLVRMSKLVKEQHEINKDPSSYGTNDLSALCGDDSVSTRLFGEGGLEVLADIKVWNQSKVESPTLSVKSKSRLLCMVYTQHGNAMEIDSSRTSPLHVIVDTWARRCDGFLAFSDRTDTALGAVDSSLIHAMIHRHVNSTPWVESYDMMWPKAQLIWTAVVTSDLIDEYDFFLLGGDDMFVIPENVQKILQSDRVQQLQGM
jgi:hypothetical protein